MRRGRARHRQRAESACGWFPRAYGVRRTDLDEQGDPIRCSTWSSVAGARLSGRMHGLLCQAILPVCSDGLRWERVHG